MEDKYEKAYNRFMDSVLALATELSGIAEEDLTDNEIEFLNAFDNHLAEIDETIDEEEKKVN